MQVLKAQQEDWGRRFYTAAHIGYNVVMVKVAVGQYAFCSSALVGLLNPRGVLAQAVVHHLQMKCVKEIARKICGPASAMREARRFRVLVAAATRRARPGGAK